MPTFPNPDSQNPMVPGPRRFLARGFRDSPAAYRGFIAGNWFVRSGAVGMADGRDWANAFTTLAAAFAKAAAGDTVWVSEDHAESQSGAMTLTAPGTAASPNRILCVNHLGSMLPVSADLRTTATVTVSGNALIQFKGFAYYYGITFATAGTNSFALSIGSAGSAFWMRFDSCVLSLTANSVSSHIQAGQSGGSDQLTELVNTALKFANTGQGVYVLNQLRWTNTPNAVLGTVPTTLFQNPGNFTATMLISVYGVDLSALGSGKSLIDVGTAGANCPQYYLEACQLGSGVSITTGSINDQSGPRVTMVDCDSAADTYRYYKQTYQGTVQQETTVVRTGGATDGTTPVSRKLTTNANPEWYSPLESDPVTYWNEATGSPVTVTIPIVCDNATLTTADVWAEAEYLGSGAAPLASFVANASVNALDPGTAWALDGTSTWATGSLTNPIQQSVTVTFTPALKGPIAIRVKLARPNTTLWFDPMVVTSTGRTWMLQSGQVNEGDDPTVGNVRSGVSYNRGDSTGTLSSGGLAGPVVGSAVVGVLQR